MKIISKLEAKDWCESKGISLDERGFPQLDNNSVSFDIPKDSGQKVSLANRQFESFRSEKEILIWITAWTVWPSCERMHIFDRFRVSYGEERPLIEAPGHIFCQNEFEDAPSFMTISSLFFWDCYVVSDSGH